MSRSTWTSSVVLGAALLLAACSGSGFTEAETQAIAALSLDRLGPVPPDPSNRVADDRAAAALGEALFSDARLSKGGTVSCASCHVPERQFQDGLPLARGIGVTDRRTMPLANVGYSPWQFWDGRRDSLWSQALTPMEDRREHGGNRAAFVHLIARHYRADYERLFGTLPDLAGVPADAGPLGTAEERAAWQALPVSTRDAIDRAFANIGKAIAAFERTLRHPETRFDRFARAVAAGEVPRGDADLTETERLGLRLFIGRANCVTCHEGPRFTDDHFHNTGVPQAAALPPDEGRASAVALALADPFNCLGPYSDAAPEQCGELRFVAKDNPDMVRAFKTPSLRGVASRPPYMHSGQIATMVDAIDHYASAPLAPSGTTEIVPLTLSEREKAALVAFLRTLE